MAPCCVAQFEHQDLFFLLQEERSRRVSFQGGQKVDCLLGFCNYAVFASRAYPDEDYKSTASLLRFNAAVERQSRRGEGEAFVMA